VYNFQYDPKILGFSDICSTAKAALSLEGTTINFS